MKSYREDNRSDIVVKPGRLHSFLVSLWSASLLRQDEPGTDPDSGSTQHQGGSNRLAVEQASSSNDLHWRSCQGTLSALDQLGHGRNKDRGGNIAGVSTAFTTLGADHVGAGIKSLLDMLRVTDHVHVENSSAVELLHDMLGRHTHGGDK
jgi:hypothetical protein